LSLELKQREKTEEEAKIKYNEAVDNKINILKESHVCPTCLSVIDENMVSQIIEKSKS
jgi:hypothetical protein